MKVLPESREVLQNEEGPILENTFLDSYAGFSKIFKLLVSLKKPLIAHNAFLDLMFMHQQFYRPLPSMYTCVTIENTRFFFLNVSLFDA